MVATKELSNLSVIVLETKRGSNISAVKTVEIMLGFCYIKIQHQTCVNLIIVANK